LSFSAEGWESSLLAGFLKSVKNNFIFGHCSAIETHWREYDGKANVRMTKRIKKGRDCGHSAHIFISNTISPAPRLAP
jgi:hypothetical protein